MTKENLYQPQVTGLEQNFAAGNQWYAHFSLEDILPAEYSLLDLHLKKFSLPLIEQLTNEVSFRGYSKAVPTGVLNYLTKELTLEFIVDQEWKNYKALYYWMSSYENTVNPVIETTTTVTPEKYLPLRIYLLDNYKRKVILFKFENTFIKIFNDINLDVADTNEVTASVTCAYDRFMIEKI